jgi:hypothetical protein
MIGFKILSATDKERKIDSFELQKLGGASMGRSETERRDGRGLYGGYLAAAP